MILAQKALKLVNRRTALVAGALGCLTYAGLFVLPRQVAFSYSNAACIREVSLFPSVNKAVDTAKFKVEYRGGLALGPVKVASTQTCFVPTASPLTGVTRVASAPWGGWIFRVHYNVAVADAPRLLDSVIAPQALSQPVVLKLSQHDQVFSYYLVANGKTQLCTEKATQLRCGVEHLGLGQGATYTLQVQRHFGASVVGSGQTVKVSILPAAKVAATSITPGELVYSKPQSADISFDKALVSATAELDLVNGDKTTHLNSRVKVDGTHVLVMWDEELPRQNAFRLILSSAEAADGSRMEGSYSINFQTSGGPQVLGADIGGADVAGDAKVVVTFDQALSKDTNVGSLASIAGGSANIFRQGDSQVVFALHDMPRCGAFTISIAKGAVSASGVPATQGWSMDSRVNCRLTKTIGYSVQGRAIQAYFYGSGDTTVLFTGGIHGTEPSGTYLLQDWAAYLDTNAYKIPAGKQVVVVPNLNPDGIAADQRYNADNVNLDRNFPTSDWVSDISLTDGQVLPQGGGVTPLSEPETQAIANLTSSLHVRAEISFHAQGSLVGANKVADSVSIGTLYAAGVGYQTVFYNPEQVFGYTLTGEYETWEGEKFGIPAILIELPTLSGQYFSRHLNMLWAMVNL